MSESVLTKKNVALVQIINRPQMSIWLATLASVALIYLASPAMDGSGDPDYYWHMLYARWILEHGAIPKADFISWPFRGKHTCSPSGSDRSSLALRTRQAVGKGELC